MRTGLAAAALDKSARVATTAAVLGLLGLLAIIVLGMEAADVAVETAHPLRALASLNVAFATLQPAALSLVLRRALAGADPDALAGAAVTVTHLAQGVPIGGALDILDDGTLAAAMKARRGR